MSSSNKSKPPTMKTVLPAVFSNFSQLMRDNPELLKTGGYRRDSESWGMEFKSDPFGEFGGNAFELFMRCARSELITKGWLDHYKARQNLLRKMHVSALGIGVVALFSEIVPLVYMRDKPDDNLTPEHAATVATNSLGFIDRIILSGGRVGASIARDYIRPDSNPNGGLWSFSGTVIGGKLDRPDRLVRYKLSDSEQDERIEAQQLDEAIEHWMAQETPAEVVVTCPAYIDKNPETSLPFTRELSDLMIDHAATHIYPEYIPSVRSLVVPS